MGVIGFVMAGYNTVWANETKFKSLEAYIMLPIALLILFSLSFLNLFENTWIRDVRWWGLLPGSIITYIAVSEVISGTAIGDSRKQLDQKHILFIILEVLIATAILTAIGKGFINSTDPRWHKVVYSSLGFLVFMDIGFQITEYAKDSVKRNFINWCWVIVFILFVLFLMGLSYESFSGQMIGVREYLFLFCIPSIIMAAIMLVAIIIYELGEAHKHEIEAEESIGDSNYVQ